ncbi:hypothetical protein P3T40_008749 [Paraburkholderia sp. EB58]|jgi:hypothetical protein
MVIIHVSIGKDAKNGELRILDVLCAITMWLRPANP